MSRSASPSTPTRRPRRPTAALIVASLALVVAAAPPAYAALKANSVGSRQIVNRSVANVDIRAGAVDSGLVANASLGLIDLADSARWRQTVTGSWSYDQGFVETLAVAPSTTTLGRLSSGGTGVLRVSRPSRVLVDGAVLAQNFSGATRRIDCNVVVGSTTLNPQTTALLLNASSTTLPANASMNVGPGTYDVSLVCSAPSTGIAAGNVHVNVVAVPLG